MTPEHLHRLPFDIRCLHSAFADGLTAESLIAEVFRRIEQAADPGIFITLLPIDEVIAQARALGPFDPIASPLWGVPLAVKDNIDVARHETTAGCPAFAYEADADATVVSRLRAAGALLIGKTNLDQFATGLVGVRSPYPPPRNALDPAMPPGGSSSGSAVAVARGLVSIALGTDTAGSGRVPAALNNIVGLKPSLGALSCTGVVPACRTLDTISIFALTAGDAYGVLQVCAAPDPTDPYSREFALDTLSAPGRKLRIGVPDDDSLECYGDQVQAASFQKALSTTGDCEFEVVPMDFTPFYEVADLLYSGSWVAERHSVIEALLAESPEAVLPVTRAIITKATEFSATDAFRDQYRLKALQQICAQAMNGLDAICVPTIPTFISLADLAADPIGPNNRLGRYTNFVNLLDLCGVATPVSTRDDGRPGSITILAPAGRDTLAASIAQAMQQAAAVSPGACGWTLPHEPLSAPQAMSGEIAVAVVGAHLSGMPLNRELTSRGARLLKATRTARGYRLYALPGDAPARPALVADATAESAIDLEIWALPRSRFADFVAGIPRPLGIGTLELEDGTTCKGFICEAGGLNGALDVSNYGGWRQYLAQRMPAAE